MAVLSPSYFLQGGSHDAQVMRQVLSALAGQDVETFAGGVGALGVGHGLVRSGHLAVSEKSGTPNMSVDVAKGLALITGTSSLAQGCYPFCNDATTNVPIATADATNPRWDLIVAQVQEDAEDGSNENRARLHVVQGTAAASPSDPAVPAGCLVLARVVVPASASSIVNANITMLAGLARGSNWNQAWGTVGYAEKTSNQTSITTETDVTGLSVTWTAVAGRRYMTTVQLLVYGTVVSDVPIVYVTDGSNTKKQQANVEVHSTNAGLAQTVFMQAVETGISAGSATRKARIARGAGSGSLTVQSGVAFAAFIRVDDIGPA